MDPSHRLNLKKQWVYVLTRLASADAVGGRGYARTERNVSAVLKRQVYSLYGVRPSTQTRNGKRLRVCCEVDHLISLELGGSNDIKNLWPEPYLPRPGARQKDVLENWLHKQVCSGKDTSSGCTAGDFDGLVRAVFGYSGSLACITSRI
jgi:hypothetical protein